MVPYGTRLWSVGARWTDEVLWTDASGCVIVIGLIEVGVTDTVVTLVTLSCSDKVKGAEDYTVHSNHTTIQRHCSHRP